MKKLLAIILAVAIALCLCACNYTLIDAQYHFDSAVIRLPDGEIVSGKVERWTDYEGDQLQITIDGITYLVHANNAALIAS